MAAIPAAVAVMSWAFLRERVPPRTWRPWRSPCWELHCYRSQNQSTQRTAELRKRAKHCQSHLAGATAADRRCALRSRVFGHWQEAHRLAGPQAHHLTDQRLGFVLATPFGLYTAYRFDFAAVGTGMWLLLVFYALAASVWTVGCG